MRKSPQVGTELIRIIFFNNHGQVAGAAIIEIFGNTTLAMKTPDSTYKRSSEATIEGHLVKIDQWLSDLDFTAEEIGFFKKVVTLYIKGSDSELQEKIDLVEKEISGLEQKSGSLKAELRAYRQSLEIEGVQQTDIPIEILLNDKLIYLQQRFNNLNHDIRCLKEDLFSITEELYGN